MKYLIIVSTFMSINICAMERQQLLPWVQKTNKVIVRTAVKQLNDGISITDTTTVAELKTSLFEWEGIPTEQQALFPLLSSWWTLKMFKYQGPKLSDEQNIKQVMSQHNTAKFLLFLSLPKSQNQK